MSAGNLTRSRIIDCLKGGGPDASLFDAADSVLRNGIGPSVYLRGLVEISNECRKNCFYCGLRRDNSTVSRYTMPQDEITASLESGYSLGLRSFLLQSGELLGEKHIRLIENVLNWTVSNLPEVRMVLSVGELTFKEYDRLRHAGAHRFLLRIETSSPELYGCYHPGDSVHSYATRLRDLEYLLETGWQTGTGVLIGLPGQTEEDLADDLLFMLEMDIDMIGMGPYIENPDTPLIDSADKLQSAKDRTLLTLRMIAIARLLMPSVNMAATTALQTLGSDGLERGLLAGANVVMPNLTPEIYRDKYNLYQGKTAVGDTLEEILEDLDSRSKAINRIVNLSNPGDALHFTDRMKAEMEECND